MSYKPKTNWKYDDTPTETDFNRIEKGVGDAYAKLGAQDGAIEDLKNKTDNMYALTDGPVAKSLDAEGVTDFNDVINTGFYSSSAPHLIANRPNVSFGNSDITLHVFRTVKGDIHQIITRLGTSNPLYTSFSWERMRIDGVWNSAWTTYIPLVSSTLTSNSDTQAASSNAVKQLNDSKAEKNFNAPISLPLLLGITGFLSCQKNDMGLVVVTTKLVIPKAKEQQVFATLPLGYRPKVITVLPLMTGPVRNTPYSGQVLAVHPNGEVIVKPIGAHDYIETWEFSGEVIYKAHS